jgi:hypothetical protein
MEDRSWPRRSPDCQAAEAVIPARKSGAASVSVKVSGIADELLRSFDMFRECQHLTRCGFGGRHIAGFSAVLSSAPETKIRWRALSHLYTLTTGHGDSRTIL